MQIDIPDDWIKRLLNADPSENIKETLRTYFRREPSNQRKYLLLALGDYALTEMEKQTK